MTFRTIRKGRLFLGLLLAILAVVALGCSAEASEITTQLDEQEGSGQSGTATFIPRGEQTEVIIRVNPGPKENGPQPLHIHFGQCGPNLGTADVILNDVVDGESITMVDFSIADLTDASRAVNLHKSFPEIRKYTSCGNMP